MSWIVKFVVVALALYVFWQMLKLGGGARVGIRSAIRNIPLMLTGFIANVADTLGLGSFAIIVASNNRWGFVDDKQLPGTLNAHGILPAMLQSLLFLNFIPIDMSLLFLFTLAACLGGFFGGFLVARLDKQSVRLAMVCGFLGIGGLILANQLHLLPLAGEETSLSFEKLCLGFPCMMAVGMLPAIGAGFYVPIQLILFLLGLSPLVAFPIMTTAGAIVQSTAAFAFIRKGEVAVPESLAMGLSGVVGVAVAVPLITLVNLSFLRWLLLGIVLYNAAMLYRTYAREKSSLVATS